MIRGRASREGPPHFSLHLLPVATALAGPSASPLRAASRAISAMELSLSTTSALIGPGAGLRTEGPAHPGQKRDPSSTVETEVEVSAPCMRRDLLSASGSRTCFGDEEHPAPRAASASHTRRASIFSLRPLRSPDLPRCLTDPGRRSAAVWGYLTAMTREHTVSARKGAVALHAQ